MKLLRFLLKLSVYLVSIYAGAILIVCTADYIYVKKNAYKVPKFDNFQFETYSNSKDFELQNALLELHPIGSETALFKNRFKGLKLYYTAMEDGKTGISISYTDYPIHLIDFIRKTWSIGVVDNYGKIESIQVESYLTGP